MIAIQQKWQKMFLPLFLPLLFNVPQHLPANEAPPRGYNLSDVRIVLEHSDHGAFKGFKDSTIIAGGGQTIYESRDFGKTLSSEFTLPTKVIQEILRKVYEIRFLGFRELYISKSQLHFDDNGSVLVGSSSSSHQFTTQVTVQIGEYRKSIMFGNKMGAPHELVQFVKYLEILLSKHIPEEERHW